MRILLFSDTHGRFIGMEQSIRKHSDVDMVIHLGDYTKDAVTVFQKFPDLKHEIIRGNNDYTIKHENDKMLTVEGLNIFITHGHLYGVKQGLEALMRKAKEVSANVVLYGHTHIRDEKYIEGVLFVNPGSAGLPQIGDFPSYCELFIEEGNIQARYHSLK